MAASDREQLLRAMAAIERCEQPVLSPELRWAAFAGLGSKYLAVGSPESIGLLDCGVAATWIILCHEILFGSLPIKLFGSGGPGEHPLARSCTAEEAFACDIVCLPSSQDFELGWIAEATHLNVRFQEPDPSPGCAAAFGAASVTVQSEASLHLGPRHGSLDEVITGKVSGRMADELTLLLHD